MKTTVRQEMIDPDEIVRFARMAKAHIRPGLMWAIGVLQKELDRMDPDQEPAPAGLSNYQIAARKRWADKSAKQRSIDLRKMRDARDAKMTEGRRISKSEAGKKGAAAKWANMTKKQQAEQIRKLTAGRIAKAAEGRLTTSGPATWWATATKKQKQERLAKMQAGRMAAGKSDGGWSKLSKAQKTQRVRRMNDARLLRLESQRVNGAAL